MASTASLFTGLTGLNAHSKRLEVIGNNIANVNTTAFKSSRMLFSSQFARTFSGGSAPAPEHGGSNPTQVGLGVQIAGTQRDFSTGAISPTGNRNDLAIEGDGFFIVQRGDRTLYTRAGAFGLNAENELTTITGERLQGYGIDDTFNIQQGALGPLTIPLGTLTVAEATRNVHFAGNLNASGPLPTRGARINLTGTEQDGLSVIDGATNPPAAGNLIQPDSLLTEVQDPLQPANPLFADGQQIRLQGAQRGGRTLPPADFQIQPGSTLRDLMDFFNDALGIHTTAGPNPDGRTPGVALNPATGTLIINGNTGDVNNLRIAPEDIRLLNADGSFVRSPFFTQRPAEADGESVRTTFIAYDSLGTPVQVDLAMVLDERNQAGTMWRYYVDSPDDMDGSLQVATGLLQFDTSGRLVSEPRVDAQINRAGTGAASPLTLTLDFANAADTITALTSTDSAIAATYQDGSPIGTLTGFAVGADGTVNGSFTNGLNRPLGQVALARFSNPEGLMDEGGNMFAVGANSGAPGIATPGQFSTGRVVGGALELSNVDLGQEFIQMILTSTGYSASSRVIRTADELMQQLLVLGR